jgi:hypothetical protein
MNIIKLLATLTVLSLLVAPALAMHAPEGCKCMSGGCSSSHETSCCDKCSDESYSHANSCYCEISTFSSTEASDLSYYLAQSRSRSYGRESHSISSSSSGNGSTYQGPSVDNSEGVGPPDLDVIEYLPPSARLVFNVLASDGPLTQKDLISKTDLPPRTVRYALSRLKEESVIRECFYFPDARQSLYGLNTETAASKISKVEQIKAR